MPTENPKISAYVPQAVYDRFKQFQEERQLSMSQATTELIAEYFTIDLKVGITNQSTSELPRRLESIEQEIKELKQLYLGLFERINYDKTTSRIESEPLNTFEVSQVNELEEPQNSGLGSKLNNELPLAQQELQKEDVASEPLLELLKENLDSSSQSNPIDESLLRSDTESVKENNSAASLPGDLPSELLIDAEVAPLKVGALAEQFSLSSTMIGKVKKYSVDKQIEYTRSKSPENRPWVFSAKANLFYPVKIS